MKSNCKKYTTNEISDEYLYIFSKKILGRKMKSREKINYNYLKIFLISAESNSLVDKNL